MASFPGNTEHIGKEVDIYVSGLSGWTLIGEAMVNCAGTRKNS
jgi:hypothetical protein